MGCSNTYQHVTCDIKPWILLCMAMCAVHVQVKHRRMSNTYIRCMEWEYRWTHAKFIDSEFLKVHQQQTESGGLSEGKEPPLLARLYSKTRIISLLKWIKWYCINKTGDGEMQISCGSFWSYSSTATLVLYKKPTCKTIDEESRGAVT